MLKSRALASALVVGSITVASVFAAAPAHAATLPAGQQITVIDGDEWQFYEASPADASLAAVGGPVPIDEYVNGVDVNDDGLGFAVTTDYSEGPFGAWLYSADANTGVLSGGVQVSLDFGDVFPDADECTAIDYTAGVVYLACIIYGDEFSATYVGPVNTTTGVLEPVIELNGSGEGFPFLYLTALATDPISGQLYGFSYDENDGVQISAWTLTEATGATFVVSLDNIAAGADFDRGGQLWVTSYIPIGGGEFPPIYPVLATLSLVDGSNPFFEPYTVAGELFDVNIDALTVWGVEPALAVTGVEPSPAVWFGATVFLLFGSILAAGAMMVRRRSAES